MARDRGKCRKLVAKPRRMTRKLHPDPEKAEAGIYVDAQYLDFNQINEDWNIWELEDGSRIKAKVTLSEVYLPFDQETGEIIRREDGAPRYGAMLSVTHVFEPSESVLVPEKAEKE